MNQHIHFIGIKGVGMTPLAIIAKEAGFIVSGCDVNETFITDAILDKAGIMPLVGFSADHLEHVTMVITTGAHGGFGNQEVLAAKEKGIPVLTQGEAVGLFMKGDLFHKMQKGISIAGCHGKTTTTAMIATMLQHAQKDPSYVIGTSEIASLPFPGHFGKGDYFIAEADEYATEPKADKKAKFLWQYPTIAIITNIEFDHPDMYASLEDVVNAYALFLKNISKDGILIINGDDENCKNIIINYKNKILTFGFNSNNNYVLSNIHIETGKTVFDVYAENTLQGTFTIPVFGEHNAMNALATIITGLHIGLSAKEIQNGLAVFTGSKRRFEYKGVLAAGGLVYDDYAHHPTEVKKTLEAFRSLYPDKKIVCIFQPHTFSRTKLLFEDFLYSFEAADTVILTDIFASKREAKDESVSSEKLAVALADKHENVILIPKLADVVQYIKEKKFSADTVCITMGAGDVYKINDQLNLQ